jgi:hypothetical protein
MAIRRKTRNEIFLTPWLLRDAPAAQGHVMRRTHDERTVQGVQGWQQCRNLGQQRVG